MKIKIVADSATNIHGTQFGDTNVEMVPLKIVNDEKEYVDTEELNIRAMLDELSTYKGKTGTSCPNVNDWITSFEDSDIVFAVTISKNLSGSYNAAVLAKETYEEENPGKKVYLVDSFTAGIEGKLLVEHIVECLNKGMEPEAIYEDTLAYHQHTHTIFSLANVDNLAKNGRISTVAAAAVGFLNLRIVGIESGGVLDPQHKVRGDKKAMKTMLEDMVKHGFNGGRVHISHNFNEKTADLLKGYILEAYPQADVDIVPTGGLMSFYGEEACIVVGYEG